MISLEAIKQRLLHAKINKHPQRHAFKRSAVIMLLREGAQGAELLMMKRAEREGDPWSGHMSFPGGRQEPSDNSIFATGVRETREEMGFDVELIADNPVRLSDIQARGNGRLLSMAVTPFVMFAHSDMEITPNHEVAEYVWIPLQHFAYAGNRENFDMRYDGKDYTLPCYFYRQYKVWGLSLKMVDELLEWLK